MTDTGAGADEGVVKYACEHEFRDCGGGARLMELIGARDALRATGLLGVDAHGVSYGNVSVRVGDPEAFLISGTQTGWLEVTNSSHYAWVSDCSLEDNRVVSHGRTAASSEALTHYAVYRAVPGFVAVVHVHDRQLWERHRGLLPTTDPTVEYGTPSMAREIERIVGLGEFVRDGLLVMGGHKDGLIAAAPDLALAVSRMLNLRNAS